MHARQCGCIIVPQKYISRTVMLGDGPLTVHLYNLIVPDLSCVKVSPLQYLRMRQDVTGEASTMRRFGYSLRGFNHILIDFIYSFPYRKVIFKLHTSVLARIYRPKGTSNNS